MSSSVSEHTRKKTYVSKWLLSHSRDDVERFMSCLFSCNISDEMCSGEPFASFVGVIGDICWALVYEKTFIITVLKHHCKTSGFGGNGRTEREQVNKLTFPCCKKSAGL